MSTIDCPLCQRVDAVQRVTAIVSGETHDASGISDTVGGTQLSGRSDYYAGSGFDRERIGDGRISASAVSVSRSSIDVTQRSRLASRLAPPSRPTKPEFTTSWQSCVVDILWLVVAGLISLAIWNVVEQTLVSFIVCSLVFLGVASLTSRVSNPVDDRVKGQERQLKTAQYNLDTKRYDEAMKRWNAMFYCRRCDVVYVPGDSFGPRDPKDTIELAYMGIE